MPSASSMDSSSDRTFKGLYIVRRLDYSALFGLSSLHGQPISHGGDKREPSLLSQSWCLAAVVHWSSGCTHRHLCPPVVGPGYASWTAKSMVHLLADLSRWLQRHALMPMDLTEQRVDAFLQDRYRRYCEIGGHPNPIAYFLLPARVLERHRNAFGSNESFWIDLAQHLRVIWADIQAIPTDHPNENVDVILQYTPVVMAAVKLWEGVDSCAPMLPQSLIDELAAVRAAAQQSRAQGCASAAPFAGHPAAPQRRLAH
jgi:hypothetical protein